MTEENGQLQGDAPKKPQRKIPRVEQAAILLMSLGEADAAEVLKHMGPKEVQRVGVAMAQMKDVSKDDVTYVLNQFVDAVGGQTGLGVGNDDYIRAMLTQALGDDKAASLIDRILIGGNTTGLDTLKWMEPRAVGDIIRYEHPQIQAIVISYLDPDQAAEILGTLDEKVRLDVMMRVASLESIQPQALQELNDILEKQFSGGAASQTSRIGGVKRAADIMNFMDRGAQYLPHSFVRAWHQPGFGPHGGDECGRRRHPPERRYRRGGFSRQGREGGRRAGRLHDHLSLDPRRVRG
ncbi:flagellar motor switch protein FliG, partial [Marinobacter sp.]|uniref:flagellar motor switch protein FliG n=1 Tax=Marinobacter sp. TaxID=50741 RepID=UPI00258974E6